MNLRYITCAGLYGNAPYDLLLNLAQVSPRVEIAVNVSPCETSGVSYHAKWLNGLLNLSDTLPAPMNIALHVNDGWCMDLCNGVVPRELGRWLERNHSGTNTPLIQRIQMNISGSAIFLSSNMPARAQRAISAISAQRLYCRVAMRRPHVRLFVIWTGQVRVFPYCMMWRRQMHRCWKIIAPDMHAPRRRKQSRIT